MPSSCADAPANLGGAQIAFMNPGGIRGGATNGFLFTPSGAEAPGEVTYGEAFTIQPFGNSLVTKTMTGAQIHLLLEQQFVGCGGQTTQRILQISAGFTLRPQLRRGGVRRQGLRAHAQRAWRSTRPRPIA